GNVLSPDGLVQTYGLDATRYFLMREIPHGQDGNFSHEQAVQRINADLANGLGNLAQRTLSMIHKNCGEKIPEPGELEIEDKVLLEHAYDRLIDDAARKNADAFAFHNVLASIWKVISACDVYIDQQAPWKLKKENPKRMETVLYVIAEAVRCIAIAVRPVVPTSANKLLDQLSVSEERRTFAHISKEFALRPGKAIDKPEGVFPRIVENEEAAE
ncbi:MAG: class I tRNA ligase family protein, partial [Alphaproteobacteria bacterium]|nr:class I tRNA ligase family protein [Alphaproteobacteria bacterium]